VIGDLNACWTPHAAQHTVLNALFLHCFQFVFNESGRKWGKTAVINYFLWRRAMTVPGGHYYLAPEQKQAKEILWASGRLQKFGPESYIDDVNNTEMRIRFKNGSFIKVDGSDNYDSYRGIEPHSAVYDEFRDFRPEFHQAMGPNLSVYKAPLLICSTPPEVDVEHYEAMKLDLEAGKDLFNYPSWSSPYFDRDWGRKEKRKLYLRGEGDVWEREYGARKVRGGSKAIFPMFSRAYVKPHQEIMEELRRDRRKLIWQVIADPGNATVFCVLFRAINPFTKKVYRLGEIYEREQSQTSTSRIWPRIQAMKEELCPAHEALGIEWEQLYDEAATWFATEALASFDDHWTPTSKGTRDINSGLSLIKDQMLAGLTVISDRCINFIRESENYIKDKNGKPSKECDDHAIDCDRYGNDYAGVNLAPEMEPLAPDPDDLPRFKTPDQDEAEDRLGRGDFDLLEDF
jgi:hypothetical protein